MSQFSCGDSGIAYANTTADFNRVYNCGAAAGIKDPSKFVNVTGPFTSSINGASGPTLRVSRLLVIMIFLAQLVSAELLRTDLIKV
jgi:hypothetical protein